jgi:hypothetical protein
MTTLNLPLLEETRRAICEQCEHYRKESDACQFLITKTGKLGLLSHSLGVSNPKARCPYFLERKWNFIPSFYAWEINRLLFPVQEVQVYEYTKAVCLSSMAMVERIYTMYDKGTIAPQLKRSNIVSIVKSINLQPNGYQHLVRDNLQVDYISGSIYHS